jgi:hypothetical protein
VATPHITATERGATATVLTSVRMLQVRDMVGRGPIGLSFRETELSDLENAFQKDGSSKLTNTFWRGDVPLSGDSESERRVLGGMDVPGNIRKTVNRFPASKPGPHKSPPIYTKITTSLRN